MDKPTVIFGLNAVVEALNAGANLESVQLINSMRSEIRREIEDLTRSRGILLLKVSRKELDRITAGAVHQGVVAVWGTPEPMDLEDLASLEPAAGKRSVLVCLDEVQDPRNLGALARSALAFGALGLVIPDRRSAGLGTGAMKASAGALCRLPVAREKNLGRALERLKGLGYWISGAAVDKGQAPWEYDPGQKVALVLGSEGSGLRPSIVSKLDFSVKIPMYSDSESLNVSVAGALMLYEWLARPSDFSPENS